MSYNPRLALIYCSLYDTRVVNSCIVLSFYMAFCIFVDIVILFSFREELVSMSNQSLCIYP